MRVPTIGKATRKDGGVAQNARPHELRRIAPYKQAGATKKAQGTRHKQEQDREQERRKEGKRKGGKRPIVDSGYGLRWHGTLGRALKRGNRGGNEERGRKRGKRQRKAKKGKCKKEKKRQRGKAQRKGGAGQRYKRRARKKGEKGIIQSRQNGQERATNKRVEDQGNGNRYFYGVPERLCAFAFATGGYACKTLAGRLPGKRDFATDGRGADASQEEERKRVNRCDI